MNERDFCYWFNGFAELSATPPTPEQWQSIREHIASVFVKVTPAVKEAAKEIAGSPLEPKEHYDKILRDIEEQNRKRQQGPYGYPPLNPRYWETPI